MGEENAQGDRGYWYESLTSEHVAVLNLLRDYRESERQMRARTRDGMRMNDTELLALRFMLRKNRLQEPVMQRDLALYLGITGASASALVRRLESDGYVTRHPHPQDGRATILRITERTDGEVRHTLLEMHQRMLEAVQGLDALELGAVRKFLTSMISAVSES